MSWTAVMPLKQGIDRKSRLSGTLSPDQRSILSDHMADHVQSVLNACQRIDRVLIVSSEKSPRVCGWRRDHGRGLNVELTALRASLADTSMIIVHGDLPLLSTDDVSALIAAAGKGVAIAPDRHGTGTNALACAAHASVAFAFGPDSCALHLASTGGRAQLVERSGLAIDVDTPDDLDCALAGGLQLPW